MNRACIGRWLGCVILGCLLVPDSAAMARGRQVTIDFSGMTIPPKPLPAGIRTIEVRRPTYTNRSSDDGFMNDDYQQRAIRHPTANPYYWWRYWGGYQSGVSTQLQEDSSYRKLLGKVRERVQASDRNILLLEVEDRSVGEDEHDRLRARGQASGQYQRGNLSPDAYIMVRIGMNINEEAARRTTRIDRQITGNLASRITGGLVGGRSSTERQMVRTVTMTVDMKLTSFSSNTILASYADSISKTEGTDTGWFGYGEKTNADFDAIAEVINDMVEQHVSRFVRQFLPVEERVEYVLSNVDDRVARDVGLLNAREFQDAGYLAREAWYASHQLNHAAAFVTGIAAEMAGQLEWAAGWYSRAWDTANSNKRYSFYKERLDRVKTQRSAAARKHRLEDRTKPTSRPRDSDGVVTITPD